MGKPHSRRGEDVLAIQAPTLPLAPSRLFVT